MEDAGAQFASPVFLHQTLPCIFHDGARKRDLSYQTPNLSNEHHTDNWNPKAWEWDSLRFVGRPLDAQVLQLATPSAVGVSKKPDEGPRSGSGLEEDKGLRLNLGGGLTSAQEPLSRPNKRVRSGSPGSTSYPMCQVDDCKEDLSTAKDYHRRHKVCEVHSKSSKALVGNQMQRFCQQCSRFHPLMEFDEGKRSCRRRLAGHNRRRRKTQPEEVASRVVLTGDQNSTHNGNLDIANLLRALAGTQGNQGDNATICSSMTERDQLIKILGKINALPLPMDLAAKLSTAGILNNKSLGQLSSGNQKIPGASASSSTMDLLAVLSATLAASAPDTLAILSQRISQSCNSEKSKVTCKNQAVSPEQSKRPSEFPSMGRERSSSFYQSTNDDSDSQIQETRLSLPLQLFISPDDYSPPKLSSSRKFYSSDSSNPIEEISPSSSPPVVQKLFPLQSMADTLKSEKISPNRDLCAVVEGSRSRVGNVPLELFSESNRGAARGSNQMLTYQGGYTSSSGSDHSSPSQTSDSQERTERIIFKLFDKDPSHFPASLRTQIYNWLSNSPLEMESYIKPGCVVLSVYLSLRSTSMEQFERNLLQHVNSLVHNKDSEFWRSGRFLMRVGRQLVSHKDGKIRICKSWRSGTTPELVSVSPLAVVCGQETSLYLRGRNLTNPGTRIHCAYMGGYTSTEHNKVTYSGNSCDEINVRGFKILGESSNMFGRCFIEVENGFKGNSFPVIIADATICKELRLLESEFDEGGKECDIITEDKVDNFGHAKSKEEVLHFLNELGWLFQRKRLSSVLEIPDYSLNRFKFLLIFSTGRDCCVLVKTILDMLVERSLERDGLSKEAVDVLSEVHLLNRAVKRKFRKMVDMLLHYSVPTLSDGSSSRLYIFPPNLAGPGGITPLHLAACTAGSEDMVDALTNDPQQIGLSSWSSIMDANNQSPHAYAITTKNESYNGLVAAKLANKRNGQVILTIANEIDKDHLMTGDPQIRHKSCTRCAIVATRCSIKLQRLQGLLQRPYIHSMLAIAAVCVCVCLFFRGAPDIGCIAPFKWENLEYGIL